MYQLTDPTAARYQVPLEIGLPSLDATLANLVPRIGPLGNLQVISAQRGSVVCVHYHSIYFVSGVSKMRSQWIKN